MKMKSHKNKSGVECYWCIGVMFNQGEIKFVTEINNKDKVCRWEENKQPMVFETKVYADDIACGLSLNFNPAIVMEIPVCLCEVLVNPLGNKAQKPKEKMFSDDRFLAMVCPVCESSEIRNGDKFCKDCGQELDWT